LQSIVNVIDDSSTSFAVIVAAGGKAEGMIEKL